MKNHPFCGTRLVWCELHTYQFFFAEKPTKKKSGSKAFAFSSDEDDVKAVSQSKPKKAPSKKKPTKQKSTASESDSDAEFAPKKKAAKVCVHLFYDDFKYHSSLKHFIMRFCH